MARQLFIHLTLIALCAANFALAQPKAVQPAQAARPDLRPGDKLEVIDMGRVRDAEFVEFTPVGLIKVRFEDDSQLAFRPQFVRWAKGINPRDPRAVAAAAAKNPRPAAKPSPAGDTAEPPANPFEPSAPSGRKWSDATGQFSITAEFVGLADGKVSLKKADGKVLSIPLEKLAAADQAVAKSLAASANPFEADVSDPAAAKPAIVEKAPPRVEVPAEEVAPGVDLVTYRGTRWVPELSAKTPWQAQPDPRPGNPPQLVSQTKFFPLQEGLWKQRASLDDINHHAWIVVGPGVGQGKDNKEPIWFERIDLKTGERLTTVPADKDYDELASVSPSGKFAAVLHGNIGSEVKILDISAPTPKLLRTIYPFHKQALKGKAHRMFGDKGLFGLGGEGNVWFAMFLDDDNLLVQDHRGDLALIDLQTLNARYRLEAGLAIVSSPNRKYVAVGTFESGGVSLVEARTGKDLGRFEGPPQLTYFAMAFHPDGSRLTGADRSRAAVWNVATGKLEASWKDVRLHEELGMPVGFGRDYDHIVMGGKNVFNMKTGTIVDQVPENSHFSSSFTHAGRQWYLVFREGSVGDEAGALAMESRELPAK